MSADMNSLNGAPLPERNARPTIRFAFGRSSLGSVLVATTDAGVCAILIGDEADLLVGDLAARFPQAVLVSAADDLKTLADRVVNLIEVPARPLDAVLDLHGTPFEQEVWRALRDVPVGQTVSYSQIAERVGAPGEAYAVGTACAANMIAVAIPCHRVVRKDGGLAGYRWGFRRKRALLKREAAA